ncbi:MAG: ATP-binding cassette domain-containing protein [Acidimicrobiia bacterium]|nr:ATP-binding cassette domain-containing protein [Acidimicrobiia bacterium]
MGRHTASDGFVVARGLVREYGKGDNRVLALDNVDLTINRGELVAVRGPSGSGKTTLLNVIGGLDRPDGGSVNIGDRALEDFTEADLVELRRTTIAYIFQAFGLIPILTAVENVEVPLRLVNTDPIEREARVAELLKQVGLAERMGHRPHELSGGEQQRVAVARALTNRPQLILADEPTGQLDSQTGREIMALLRDLVDDGNLTILVATHDPDLLDIAHRVIHLTDGQLSDTPPTPT